MKTKHLIIMFPLTVLVLFAIRTATLSNADVVDVEKPQPRFKVTEVTTPRSCPFVYLLEDSNTGDDHLIIRWSEKIKVIKLDKPEPVQTMATNMSLTNNWFGQWYPTNIWIGPGILTNNLLRPVIIGTNYITNLNVGL